MNNPLRISLFHRLFLVWLGAMSFVSCSAWQSTPVLTSEQLATQTAFGTVNTERILVFERPGKPRLTTVAREGDPVGAIAVLVLTGGDSTQSVALAGLMEQRLDQAGQRHVDVMADRFGYRVRVLVTTAAEVQEFFTRLRAALQQPVESASPELKKAIEEVQELHRRPLDGPDFVPVADCTGELGSEPSKREAKSIPTAAQIEAWRRDFHGASRISLAVVGPSELGESVRRRMEAEEAWAEVTAPRDPWPEGDELGTYVIAGVGTRPRLTVAARVGSTFAVSALADRFFNEQGPLASRLATSTSWRLTRTTATVRPRGACLSVTVERDPARRDEDLAEDAARIASHIAHEIQVEVEADLADASEAGKRVLRASDPRDAASLAVWWSYAARLEPGPTRTAIALGIPAGEVSPQTPSSELERHREGIRTAFQTDYSKFAAVWKRPTIDSVFKVERGQGEFWLLLASPCGTASETEADAGFTALAALSSAYAGSGTSGVQLEPWITQDGVGILAHAAPQRDESPQALARRVGEAAAGALLGPPPPEHIVTSARGRLLSLFESPNGPHNEAHGLLARALSPRHPAWLAPFGLRKAVIEADARSIELRRHALSNGPLRVAVLANENAQQAEIAAQTVDRWIVYRSSTPRTCPPVPASTPSLEEAKDVTIESMEKTSQALLGLALHDPTPGDMGMMELLRDSLGGEKGWMTEAFRSFASPVRIDVRTLGQRRTFALVVEVHCASDLIDQAIQQARALLLRMQKGAATEELLRYASTQLEKRRLTQRLDPRNRLARCWRKEEGIPPTPSLLSWNTWLAKTLRDEKLAIVRIRPSDSK